MDQRQKARKSLPGFDGPGRPRKFAGGGLAKALLEPGGLAKKVLGGDVPLGGILTSGKVRDAVTSGSALEMIYGALKKKNKAPPAAPAAAAAIAPAAPEAPRAFKKGGRVKKGC